MNRRDWEKRVNEVQESLFEGAVDVHVLAEAAKFLKPDQYDDVVVERVAEKTCGYPLCDKPVTKRKGQYHISRSKLKVYDATELSKYCSATCLAISRYYRRQLLDDPIYLRDFNKLPKFEVIPCNISPSDISNLTVPHPDKVSRDQLLSEYVQSLLDRLPHVAGIHIKERTDAIDNMLKSLSIKEKTHTEDHSTQIGLSDPFAIEGFILRPTESGSTTDVIPEYATKPVDTTSISSIRRTDSNSTLAASVSTIESLGILKQRSNKGKEKKEAPRRSVTWKFPIEEPKTIPSRHSIIEYPSRPPITTSPEPLIPPTPKPNTPHPRSSKPLPNDDVNWLKPSKNPPKPTLSLFGRLWTFLDQSVTDETREFVETGLPPDPVALAERALALGADLEDEVRRRDAFCQKILRSINILKRAYAISASLTDDIIALVGTFQIRTTHITLTAIEERVMAIILLRVLRHIVKLDDDLKEAKDWEMVLEGCGMTLVEVDVIAKIMVK